MLKLKLKFDQPPLRVVLVGDPTNAMENPPEFDAGERNESPLGNSVSAEEFERVDQLITKIANDVDRAVSSVSTNSQSGIELAIELSRMIVEKLIADSPSLMESRLRAIVDEAFKSQPPAVAIHVNPISLATVTEHFQSDQLDRVDLFVADSTVPAFECRIAYENFDLVSNVNQQLDHIESLLQELDHE